ncbi:N-acetylglucosamine-6-phosphate deacetylase [Conexibacter stalactiti]|uniref:N-acetylglucosamine-6-phosphate deacetylase n=1 Tax=Conexibacter stalactiti TaxID=1940611 RepID=A0ABU4HQF7_9ACTN|nr:N-acetylglucosamine-6-phosphate deacetylase [Conexibacter stalactiti]MDW5595543.1 N-acetylglucosamine-6-phosphate deacetylase [Conexibacter stalactiti]MEC5036185.1 N-acetylglucosamine-6-phosphate deacetylase [Conexibacter stalactiti]
MSAASLTLSGGRVVTPDGVRWVDVVVRAGRIAELREPGPRPVSPDGERIELDGQWLLPGFVDLHVHGGDGAQFNTDDPAEVQRAAAFHAGHGTTALLATTVAAPVNELLSALDAIGAASAAPRPGAAEVLGAHLEGPFLSAIRPGAMEAAHFMAPVGESRIDVGGAGAIAPLSHAAERLLGHSAPRSISLAPELPGALELTRRAVARGLLVSLAHSDADYGQAVAAIEAGARAVTHAFNAMRPLHHRDPGLLGAALDRDELTCEVICDGVHVDPAAVRLLMRCKGAARTVLVTDAIEATGLPDGDYRLGDRAIRVRTGRATLPGSATIAGATLTMDAAVRNAVAFGGVTLADAARMAATTPAELLGIGDRKGSIAPGRDADLVVLDRDLALTRVLARGAWVDAAARVAS